MEEHRRPPTLEWPPLHVVHTRAALLTAGIEERALAGVTVPRTSPARTVADCFKWRSNLLLDAAVESLRGDRAA